MSDSSIAVASSAASVFSTVGANSVWVVSSSGSVAVLSSAASMGVSSVTSTASVSPDSVISVSGRVWATVSVGVSVGIGRSNSRVGRVSSSVGVGV